MNIGGISGSGEVVVEIFGDLLFCLSGE